MSLSALTALAGNEALVFGENGFTITFTSCTFYFSAISDTPSMFFENGGGLNYTFTNCILYAPVTYSIVGGGSPTNVGSTNNCVFGFTSLGWTNTITGDPLFVDPTNGNFNLRPDLIPASTRGRRYEPAR